MFILSDPARGQFDDSEKFDDSDRRADSIDVVNALGQVWQITKSNKALAWVMIGAVLMHLPVGSAQHVMNWMTRERGFDLNEILKIYGLAFLVFGVIGSLIGGIASDWYLKRYRGGRLRFLAVFMLIIVPFMISYRFVSPESPLFYIGMCCLLYTSPSPRDQRGSRMPSSA